jgi:ERCC4-type nuclease
MSQATSAQDSPAETAKKIKHYIDTKRYIDEPEILPWYKKELDEIKPRTRELLEKYSNIPPADVEEHVKHVVSVANMLQSKL